MAKQPRPRAPKIGPKPFRDLEEARRAGQLEFQLPLRSTDPRLKFARAEENALRRQRRRKRRMGVFT
jgi:hypothetical protein